jgi:hypothetical protein
MSRAETENNTPLTRRNAIALFAAASVPIVPAVAAIQIDGADARLVELGREFDRLVVFCNECFRQSSLTFDAGNLAAPAVPDTLRPKVGDRKCGLSRPVSIDVGDGLYGHSDVAAIRELDNPRAREIVRDYDAYKQGYKAAMEQSGYKATEKEIARVHELIKPITQEIIGTPAQTLEGMKVKARVVYWCRQGDIDEGETATDDRTAASIVCDLMLLQGHEPMDCNEYHARYVMREIA